MLMRLYPSLNPPTHLSNHKFSATRHVDDDDEPCGRFVLSTVDGGSHNYHHVLYTHPASKVHTYTFAIEQYSSKIYRIACHASPRLTSFPATSSSSLAASLRGFISNQTRIIRFAMFAISLTTSISRSTLALIKSQ